MQAELTLHPRACRTVFESMSGFKQPDTVQVIEVTTRAQNPVADGYTPHRPLKETVDFVALCSSWSKHRVIPIQMFKISTNNQRPELGATWQLLDTLG
ncbi:hypothetical protein [Burkholderia thailandensis]|uniref:hypothetical protein n=1 Tax=Burkholderia thailandensis TaxID=57975 RepID=UPI000FD92F39|nr:hypothetical protein [Burkholderia thailandensis]